jgi:ferredoxin-NADP reductase/predicted pyridoxine 5'-phosphate oxidase superfamily flavin-nucleotide-binding protein
MARNFSELAFTPTVRAVQTRLGSRAGYATLDDPLVQRNALSSIEIEFITARDSFFQASVGENGWPYVQHRGGPPGFLKVLGPQTIAYADFRGNAQYISVGNLMGDDRVSLILMDYAEKRRLKLWGRARLVELHDDPEGIIDQLELPHYRARVERGVVITVEAFDWNCPQHITPRYTEAQIAASHASLRAEVTELRAALAHSHPVRVQTELGSGPLALVVTGVRQVAPDIRAYELRAADGSRLPKVLAGAHLDLPLRLPDGREQTRRYSIASDPAQRERYEVAVLREPNGSGGSVAVHELYTVGLRLKAAAPGNGFMLHDDARPAVLVAGGIGITPLKAMAHELAARGTPFTLHYAARTARQFAFLDELRSLFGARLRLYDSAAGERMNLSALVTAAPAEATFYVCGPARLIDGMHAAAKASDVPPDRVRHERFAAPAVTGDRAFVVELKRSGRSVAVAADQSILEAVQASGVDAPAACRTGTCGTCAVKVLEGEPVHRDSVLTEEDRTTGRKICICVSRAQGGHLQLDL